MMSPQPYANPYLAGVGLGVVLLAAFVLTGQGLGASGAFANVSTAVVSTVAPEAAAENPYFESYLAAGAPWTAWMVIEVLGIVAGGALSALLAGRFSVTIDKGPGIRSASRLVSAASGGALMGLGAVLARGCTSGQALSGGSMLSVGSWAFMIAAFAAGYAAAPLARRLWA
jgi:uncharacterized membrane protein YedE/YeeE